MKKIIKKGWLLFKEQQKFTMSICVILLTARVCFLEDNLVYALLEFVIGTSITLAINPSSAEDLLKDD